MIDFRSDTVTLPTPEMREVMFTAAVGDDVYGEDPTVNLLQERAANLFGMEAALFCPTGTMTNQIAIKLLTQPMSEVICDQGAHVYLYEGGGIAFNSASSTRVLPGDRGRLTARQIKSAINADDVHFPATRLVCLENTSNRGGGSCYSWDEVLKIREVCSENGLSLYLDGARLFNALIATGQSALDYGRVFDGISICLSKGLGAPVGSILIGKKQFIHQARRVRKVLGGGMRQAGFLAAAGLYALDHHIERLREDHRRAKTLGQAVEGLSYVEQLLSPETNMVLFSLKPGISRSRLIAHMADQKIKVGGYTSDAEWVRLVVHLGIGDDAIERAVAALRSFSF